MSIAVVCPTCQARVSAPDDSAGRRVKCPKCQNPVAVPRAGPEDEPDDRPVRRRRRFEDDEGPRESGGGGGVPVVWVAVGVAFVLGLVVAGAAAFYLFRSAPARPVPAPVTAAPPAPTPTVAVAPPVKWVPFDNRTSHYTAAFPNKAPTKTETLDQLPGIDPKQLAEALGPELSKELGLGAGGQMTSDAYSAADGGRRYVIGAMVNPAGLGLAADPAKLLGQANTLAAQVYPGAEIESTTDIKVAGYPAKDFILRHGGRTVLARYIAAGDHFFTLRVEGDPEMKPDDATAAEFLGKFQPYPPRTK